MQTNLNMANNTNTMEMDVMNHNTTPTLNDVHQNATFPTTITIQIRNPQ